MEIKVNISAPELSEAIIKLAEALSDNSAQLHTIENVQAIKEQEPKKEKATKKSEKKPEPEKKTEPEKKPEKGSKETQEISLDVVTSKVRAFIQNGGKAKLKAFLAEHGAEKVTDLDPSTYPALLELVE